MDSQQLRRENVTDERTIEVEKDTVPKMASHFEHLADQTEGPEEKPDVLETMPVKVGGIEFQSLSAGVGDRSALENKSRAEAGKTGQVVEERPGGIRIVVRSEDVEDPEGGKHQAVGFGREREEKWRSGEMGGAYHGSSLDEIANARAQAQQASMEAVRAAEQRYHDAKESGAFEEGAGGVKAGVALRSGATKDTGIEKGQEEYYSAKDTLGSSGQSAADYAAPGKDYAAQKAGKTKDAMASTGEQGYSTAKDTLASAGKTAADYTARGRDYTAQKTGEAKDTLASAGKTAADYGARGKDFTAQKAGEAKDTLASAGKTAADYAVQGKDYAVQKAGDAKDTLASAGKTATDYAKHAKDYTAQKAGDTKDAIASTGEQGYSTAKDTLASAGRTAADYTVQAKDYTMQKAGEAKDTIAEKGQSAAQYAGDIAKEAKDSAVDTSRTAAQYAEEKAAAAKDATVETGKTATGYVGKAAGAVKDKATVAGWGAAHYTLEKVAEATKAAAGVASGVAGYTGDTAVAAKDKLAGVGQSAAGYAGEKLAAVKDAVVATEEKAADYAARKKAEAQRAQELKKTVQDQGESGGTITGTETYTSEYQDVGQQDSRPLEKLQEFVQMGGTEHETGQEHGGGVLQAIGETIVEIGQTTKDLLVGEKKQPHYGHQHHKEGGGEVEEPYRSTGEGI